jgi:hypothetical protein
VTGNNDEIANQSIRDNIPSVWVIPPLVYSDASFRDAAKRLPTKREKFKAKDALFDNCKFKSNR